MAAETKASVWLQTPAGVARAGQEKIAEKVDRGCSQNNKLILLIAAQCSPPCSNGGKCRKSGKCKCLSGFAGATCQERRKGRSRKENKKKSRRKKMKKVDFIKQYLGHSASDSY